MLKGAYDMIFRKIKEIKGYSLEDYPSTWYEIIRAFDQIQNAKVHGLQIAQKLINETKLWLKIIESIAGRDSPKFIVGSNKIGYTCLQLISDQVELVCTNALEGDFLPHRRPELLSKVTDAQNMLKRIGELYMIPEVRAIHKDIMGKLAIATEYLNAEVSVS